MFNGFHTDIIMFSFFKYGFHHRGIFFLHAGFILGLLLATILPVFVEFTNGFLYLSSKKPMSLQSPDDSWGRLPRKRSVIGLGVDLEIRAGYREVIDTVVKYPNFGLKSIEW